MRSLLDAQPGIEVVGEADDGQEAIKLMETLSPDIAILDVMMPNLNGIEAAKLAHKRELNTRIIFLTMHANAAYAVRALKSGGIGYVLKDSDFNEILQAIESAMEGRHYLSPLISDEVLEMLLKTDPEKEDTLESLSPREREILQLIAEGNTNQTIAEKLSLSVRTVESHRSNIMKKLRFNSHADLVKFAINQGLTSS
jgi:DNA-binding NarL/FixJ family response regulator